MKHRTWRAFRPGAGWQARCCCGWRSEWQPVGGLGDREIAVLRRVHEAQPEPPDWSIPASWLGHDDRR